MRDYPKLTYSYERNGASPAPEDEVGFTTPESAVATGRLGFDPATEPSPGGVDMGGASFIVGTKIDGTLGSSKGPITGRTRTGSIPKRGGGGGGAGGAKGGTIPATGDLRIHYPGREIEPRSLQLNWSLVA